MTNSATYNIDFKKLVCQLLPVLHKKPKHKAWLHALMQPLIVLYSFFVAFRSVSIYRLAITPQVCFLEKLLNDKYDVALRRIVIDEAPEIDGWVLHQKVEAKKQVLYKKSEGIELELYTKAETTVYSVDFIVQVPVAMFGTFDLKEFRAYLDAYKLVTKTYKVQFV